MHFLIFLNSLIAINAFESLELRVYNGFDLDVEENGYLVFLRIIFAGNARPPRSECSGSIISANWVITAAHCLSTGKAIATISVNQFNNKIYRLLATVIPNNVFVHPSFNNNRTIPNYQNDIALLNTTRRILFNDYVWPIKLARIPPRINQSVTIAGYGKNELGQSMPRGGNVKITKCPKESLFGNLLCAYDKIKAGSGDSGGALTSKGKLVGITSGVLSDCDLPQLKCITIYANVAAHYSWIIKVTGLQ